MLLLCFCFCCCCCCCCSRCSCGFQDERAGAWTSGWECTTFRGPISGRWSGCGLGDLSHNRAVGIIPLSAPGPAAVQKGDQGGPAPPAHRQLSVQQLGERSHIRSLSGRRSTCAGNRVRPRGRRQGKWDTLLPKHVRQQERHCEHLPFRLGVNVRPAAEGGRGQGGRVTSSQRNAWPVRPVDQTSEELHSVSPRTWRGAGRAGSEGGHVSEDRKFLFRKLIPVEDEVHGRGWVTV